MSSRYPSVVKHVGPLETYPEIFSRHRTDGHIWERIESRRGGFEYPRGTRRITWWRRIHRCTCGMERTVIFNSKHDVESRRYDPPDGYRLDLPWDRATRLELRGIVLRREAVEDMAKVEVQ